MTRTALIALFIFLVSTVNQVSAKQDSLAPAKLERLGHELVLNGSGIRTKLFTDAYVASLYLKATSQDALKIINDKQPQLMNIRITSSLITQSLLNSSIKDGLKRSAGDDYDQYAAMLDEVMLKQEISVELGDLFDFYYIPGKGTSIYRNAELLGVVPTYRFKQILFGIWLGESPIQKDLKRKLLKASA